MNPKLSVLLDRLLDGRIIRKGMFKNVDLDEALTTRDGGEFEKEFRPVDKDVERLRKVNPISKKEMTLIGEIRETAFLCTFNLTQHDDASGDISDDFELIATALVLGVQDPWRWTAGEWVPWPPTSTDSCLEGPLESPQGVGRLPRERHP